MPTTYTHDAFGKETYKRLPDALKKIVKTDPRLYLIGLHGPDILFYYKPYLKKENKIEARGHEMHKQVARAFFQQGIEQCRKTKDKALESYLYGFACHYILDSTCHPYVFASQDKYHVSHAHIETELDRYYMERDGKDPFSYKPACGICPSLSAACVIQKMFPDFKASEIRKALSGMRFYCGITVTKTRWKKQLLKKLTDRMQGGDEIADRMMNPEPDFKCMITTKKLAELYNQALDQVVPAIENLHQAILGQEELSARFDRNYC